ncbi:MAG: DUF1349 domain-containing protein [Candidatus Omnitrophica bacterium]|nr:DUF1349 domain-containing protein [Candidatus Omnitrophota bacterium]
MTKLFPFLIVLICLFFIFACSKTTVVSVLPVEESFKTPLAKEWSWVRENTETQRISEKGLEIQLEPGSLMGGGKGVKNILVRPLPEEANQVSVEVEFIPENQYEQAGLMLYCDDDRYIKLVKEFVDGEPWIVMAVEIDAQNPLVQKIPAPGDQVKIRFSLDGDGVTGACWNQENADSPWMAVASFSFPMSPRPMIGVFTQNGQPETERWACFTNFRITKEAAE